jgi:Rne/Rng family ribonuclease
MTKEMYVSSTPHETKVAVTEDDQLAEIFFERENEYTLAGSIYKGRVTRVLPGMQSAFVDIGLERDAFLYVSDFLDLEEEEEGEFDDVSLPRPEAYVSNPPAEPPRQFDFVRPRPESQESDEDAREEVEAQPSGGEEFGEAENGAEDGSYRSDNQQDRGFRGRRRRRMRRGRGFGENKFDHSRDRGRFQQDLGGERDNEAPRPERESFSPPAGYEPIVLPGESISKYQRAEVPAAVQREQGLDEPVGEAEEQASTEHLETAHPPQDDVVAEFPAAEVTADETHASSQAQPAADKSREASESDVQPKPRAFVADAASFVLPGESIAKYHGERADEAEASTEPAPPPPAPKKRFSHPLPESVKPRPEPVIPEPTADTFHPFVLPGESLSKYRGKPGSPASASLSGVEKPSSALPEAEATEASVTDRPTLPLRRTEDTSARRTPAALVEESHFTDAAFVIESDPLGVGEQPPARQSAVEEPVAAEQRAAFAPEDAEPAVEPTEREPEVAPDHAEPESEATLDRAEPDFNGAPHLPGVGKYGFTDTAEAQDAVHTSAPEEAKSETHASSEAEAEHHEATPAVRHEFAPGEGDLEHEEIEGDETEVAHYMEDELEDYEELEEEHFEPMAARGQYDRDELTSAIEETDEERAAMAESYPEEDELAEPELEEEEESAGDETNGRAEHRGPDGRAAYQQRAPRPAPFDRNRRGRRGGRRMQRGGSAPRRESSRQPVLISDLLKEGQEVLVQIAKEPIGKKGARITSHIALPGRFLVYMPTVNHIGVSRKINNDEERMRLKRIMISEREGGHGGFIVRTAAEGVGEDELRADIRFLKHLWAEIKQRSENSKAPALIYHDLNLVERVLRDQVTSDFSQVWVDTESEYERILRFANRFQPSLMRKVKLYTKEAPLFEQFNIQEEINKSLKSKVWLKSGGYIVINQTEALVAIDVNTGKYVGKTARLEDTIVKTNVDAIKEIVRQIRLRDLGGIIVVDFIDMDERKNRTKVMQALSEALKGDRAPSKVLAFNDFGLVAITRKRVKQSLERTLGTPCPYCTGTGFTKSVTTVCNEIYVEMKKMSRHLEHGDVMLRVNPEVAKNLKSSGGRWLQELEELTGRNVIVKSDPLLHQEQFDIH